MTEVTDYTGILSGGSWSGVNYSVNKPAFVTYSFETAAQPYLTTADFTQSFLDSFSAFTETEKTAARAALAQWGDASGLVFLEVSAGEGDIRFGSYDFATDPNTAGAGGQGYYGYSYVDPFYAYRSPIGGDVFINHGEAAETGLLLHEIGHALGFKHPFEGDPTLTDEYDDTSHTVMSYTGDPPSVLGDIDLQAVAHVYGDASSDGTQVQSWSWNPIQRILTQIGFSTDDVIFGVSVRDVIDGGIGNDRIGGFEGDDQLSGGAGDDRLFGNEGNDVIVGGDGEDYILGGAGNDTIRPGASADVVFGEGDSDTVDYSESGQAVSVDLSTGVNSGGDAQDDYLDGIENLTGSANADTLTGNEVANRLNGGAGADTLTGGAGNDTYYIDNAGDVVVESAGQGTADWMAASVTYTLGAGVQVEKLSTTNTGLTTAIDLTGNEFAQAMTGNAGNNRLNGAGGADTMTGLGGNDTYYVDNAGDKVVEGVGQGTADWVASSIGYTLAAGVQVEKLSTTSSGLTTTIDLTGNEFAQAITGNAGANRLNGASGADTMTGLGGNDIYYVDNAGDKIVEGAGGGTADWVASSISYTLGAGIEVEKFSTTNTGLTTALDLTGNEFAQAITGNAGANRLNGMGGADTMTGLGGNDTYYIDNAGDKVVEGAGQGTADWVATSISYTLAAGVQVEKLSTASSGATSALSLTGNEFAQTIVGNAGANTINGKLGNDTLTGGAGNDIFVFDTTLNASTNVDKITDFSVGADKIQLEDSVFLGLATGVLDDEAFYTGASATEPDDRIVYDSATGKLYYDSNGSDDGGAIQFATLLTSPSLTYADFIVV